MDPDANLEKQRTLAAGIIRISDACTEHGEFTAAQRNALEQDAVRLAELVQALDNWIIDRGFLPREWREARRG